MKHSKETFKRNIQKKHSKETFKRNIQKKHSKETFKRNIQKNFNTITNIIILLILIFGGIGYSVGFHFPFEILPGQFANGNYSFNGSLGIGTSSPTYPLSIGDGKAEAGIHTINLQGVTTTAKNIVSIDSARGSVFMFVTGASNTIDVFNDVVLVDAGSATSTTLHSLNRYGSPGARTYSYSVPNVKVAVAGGALYDITVLSFVLPDPR